MKDILNDPSGSLMDYEAYAAMSNHEVALRLWPVMDTWSMPRLSEETGINQNTLYKYMKVSFLDPDGPAPVTSKPLYVNYLKIMAAGRGEKTPWHPRFEAYLKEHPGAAAEEMRKALDAPAYAVRRFQALYPDKLMPTSLLSESQDARLARDALSPSHERDVENQRSIILK